ncbi:IPT/TIG domain-containing protein [Hymenobacter cheonanensis]|uniref:IPT/TIG domain-containing protein n=1 Tax=Hymenobacter sp. CA2-7 TaxID=3063993 RepID=UPI00271444B6|nr:IPT/TIG domain-containing protein [Hymenobacter sp. CA2-7]MDO7884562.1 IPT/TIG domain-containing protein [Hymenobacter sp. CA2-7]
MTHFFSLSSLLAARRFAASWLAGLLAVLLLLAPLLGQAQPTPYLTSLSPTSGSTGTSVIITGANLGGTNTSSVAFVGPYGFPINATFTVNSAGTQISTSVPAGAITGAITVTCVSAAGVVTTLTTATFTTDNYLIGSQGITVCSGNIYDDGGPNANYRYNQDYSTTISPATAGSKIRLSFTQFDIDLVTAVFIIYDGPDVNAPVIGQYKGTNSPGVVTATNAAGQLTIRLVNFITANTDARPGFAATIACVAGLPIISSFSPDNGAAGTSVTITGLNFNGTTAVAFNGVAAPFTVNSNTQLTVSVPAGATTGPITVTNALATGRSASSFVVQPLTISSFSPTSGTRGTSVTITGLNFTGATAVAFNGASAVFSVNSGTQITATVPAGATTGSISVTTPSGTGTSTSSFTVLPLTIDSFTPTTGAAGTSVTITGLNFSGATAVRFNGASAVFSVNSNTQITATVPAGATTGPISVTTPSGTGTSTTNFVLAPPVISSFSPASGLVGASVVITGTSFLQTSAVRFNGTAASGFVVNSDTQITVNVPAGATTGSISVTTPSGTGTSTSSFMVLAPTISSFSPASGLVGSGVVITGTNFTGATAVRFNGTAASGFTVTSDTQINVNVPAGASTGLLSVTTPTGTGTSASSFTVLAPAISSFSPTSGTTGTSVIITGTYFTGATAVRFNGTAASGFVVNSDTQITVPVPAGATNGPISVTTPSGTGTSATSFTVLSPAISSFTPTSGGQSVSVTITGVNFTGATAVRFNGALAPGYVVNSDTQITVNVPAGASTGPITVTTPSGTATSATSFTVLAPAISSFSPTSGTAGTSVVITGANFTGTTAVAFNATAAASFVVNSDTQITASVAAGTLSGFITVTNGVGTATSASNFVTGSSQIPLLTAVSPARNLPTAPPGANVVLTFSQPMAASTAGNVRVFGAQRGGQLVRGGNATASGNTITVDPARPFAPGERVMVTVPATVQSTAGYNTLARVHEFTAATVPATGTFPNTPTSLTMGRMSAAIALGDLNGDGLLDLATSDYDGTGVTSDPNQYPGVVVRLGVGGGRFSSTAYTYYGASTPGDISLGDVDGDGDLDIAVVSTTDPGPRGGPGYQVNILLNDGQGQFPTSASKSISVYNNPTHAVLGDVDGDGDLDMLIAANKASVSFNNGSGTFTDANDVASSRNPAITVPTPYGVYDAALADVDGDGDLDALIANYNVVSVRLNNGSGVFGGGTDVPVVGVTTKLVVGDVNGDGYLDFATSCRASNSLSVRLNLGNGTFGGGADYPVSFTPGFLTLGDLDGDGDLDLVTGNGFGSTIATSSGLAAIRFNSGNGTFSGGSDFATGGSQACVALGDLDGDGTLDLATGHTGTYASAGAAASALYLRFNTALPPTIAAFSPQSGPAGTPVTFTGTNLTQVRGVRFGASTELAPITAQTATSLTVLVPVRAASGVITLTSAQGVSVPTATAFTYTPRPLGLVATLTTAGPLDVCTPRTLTATAASPVFAAGTGVDAGVFVAMEQPNGKLLLGGNFTTYQGATANHLIQLNPDGSPDATFSTGTGATAGFNNTVNSAALQADGKLLVGGFFTTYQGAPANGLIRLNPDGSPDATFNTGAGFTGGKVGVNSLVVQPDGKILLGGDFTTYQGAPANGLIRLNPDGSPDATFNTGAGLSGVVNNTVVNSIVVQPDGKVLLGGDFTTYQGVTATRLIRLNADGSRDASFATGSSFNSTVNALALQADGKVLVGGGFSQYIARLNPDGSPDATFTPGSAITSTVNYLALQADGKILVVGTFNTTASPVNNIARLNATGSLDGTFNAGGSGFDKGARRVLVQSDGNLLVAGGQFTTYNGAPAPRLIRLNPNGSPNTAPTPVSGATFTFSPGSTTTNPLVASAAGTYSVVASLNGATSAASNAVVLTPCTTAPTVTALSAAAELPGMPITLTGTGFAAGSTVSFGGIGASSVTVNSATSITAVVPAGATPGSSVVVVTAPGLGSSASAPPFTVLAVYDGATLGTCLTAVPATTSINDGAWHYLLSSGGQVVAAYNYTGASLGDLSIDVLLADPSQPVRQDGNGHYYLGRNWHLTNSAGRFDGRTVGLRLYGLNTEQARLQVADPTATLTNLKATQYSGANEDCQLANDDPSGERRVLPAPASSPSGTSYFVSSLAVADHFSEFYLTGSSVPLPVELVDFTAQAKGQTVQLSWRTASEKNSARFEVERSLDGSSFTRIGQVAAAGSSTTPRNYELLDAQVPAGATLLYYRLRQVDQDAKFSYSPVRTVAVTKSASLALFPNPTTSARGATLTGAVPGAPVHVYDALGREVLTLAADATGKAVLELPRDVVTGVYVVRTGTAALRLVVN